MAFNKKRNGGDFSPLEKLAVWQKGTIVPGHDPSVMRKDCCDAWMSWFDYGDTNSQFGWEIDHIFPVAHGGGDEPSNLQPLQWQNNRSKGDSLFGNYCVVNAR